MELKPIVLKPEFHPKGWGHELWLANNEEFCGKVLQIRKGCKFSMHFHRDKREVFWLLQGRAELHFINPEDASEYSLPLSSGQCVEIPRLLPHQIRAIEDCQIIEFSTTHREEDSYRVRPGDSQAQSVKTD